LYSGCLRGEFAGSIGNRPILACSADAQHGRNAEDDASTAIVANIGGANQ
jgi:hypothetical protein